MTVSMSASVEPAALPLRTSAFQNICGDGYDHVASAPSAPALGIDELTRSVESGCVCPGAGCWFAVDGMRLRGSIGSPYALYSTGARYAPASAAAAPPLPPPRTGSRRPAAGGRRRLGLLAPHRATVAARRVERARHAATHDAPSAAREAIIVAGHGGTRGRGEATSWRGVAAIIPERPAHSGKSSTHSLTSSTSHWVTTGRLCGLVARWASVSRCSSRCARRGGWMPSRRSRASTP